MKHATPLRTEIAVAAMQSLLNKNMAMDILTGQPGDRSPSWDYINRLTEAAFVVADAMIVRSQLDTLTKPDDD